MNVKKLTTMALLLSLALVIFVAESFLPPLVPMPGVKLGLANIITLAAVYLLGRKEAFAILVLRIVLASVFSGGMSGFLYSMAGGLVCFAVTALLSMKLKENRMWVVSVFGAIGHNIGQIAVACIVIGSAYIMWYIPFLVISAIITGVFTGIAAQASTAHIRKLQKKVLKP